MRNYQGIEISSSWSNRLLETLVEVWENSKKAVETLACCLMFPQCQLVFPQHILFSQTSTSVSITWQKHSTCFFLFLNWNPEFKGK